MTPNTALVDADPDGAAKRRLWATHPGIVFNAPPVCTTAWEADDWIVFVDWTRPANAAILEAERARETRAIHNLLNAAMDAEERYTLDELEEYARTHPKGGS